MKNSILYLLKNDLSFEVTIDRPRGFKDSYGNIYPINYGFIPGIIAGDDEYQDAYVLIKENKKIEMNQSFRGNLIAIIERLDDVETKWVISDSFEWTLDDIKQQTNFIEKYFDSSVYLL